MFLIMVAVVTICVELVYGQSSSCFTPDGKSGECIKVSQCEYILTLINKPMKTEQDLMLLRYSHCGVLDGVRKVCCPKLFESEPVYSINGSCSTPDGKPGTCVGLHLCPHIQNMLIPPVAQENVDFVRNSKCNSPEQYPVCCGPHSEERQSEERPVQTDCTRMTAFPPDPRSQCCGISASFGIRIRAGDPTAIEDHPWTVVIEYKHKKYQTTATYCGGALISGKYVLTAAHCITGKNVELVTPTVVRLGEYNIKNEGKDCVTLPDGSEDCTDGAIRIAIERTIPHPMYDGEKSKINDFGLIRLKETAPYSDFIRPVCLPTKDLTRPENTPPSFSMYAVGWGATKLGAPQSDIKQHVNLPFVSYEKCQPIYYRNGRSVTLAKTQLCAGGEGNKDACKGDSGGPLVYENKDKYQLIGIVSFGPVDCGQPGVPGIYSNVYEYLDWIKSVIVA